MSENAKRWAGMEINPASLAHIQAVVDKLSTAIAQARYKQVEARVGVPWRVVAVIHERESSQSWRGSLAQGDPWNEVSTHVPKGIGPFSSWVEAAVYAMKFCGPRPANNKDWSAAGTLDLLERYNGLGYAKRQVPSPYLWAGTNQYSAGKFIADGHFDPEAVDKQIGCAPMLKLLGMAIAAKPTELVEQKMNPISLMMTVFTLAQTVAPLLPTLVGDVKTFANDMEKIIGDLKQMDGSATIADIEKLFADLQSDLPMVTNVIAASKNIKF